MPLWAWMCGLGLALGGALGGVGLAGYLIYRGAALRAPRVLPNGYTVARYTHEGARGWGLTSPSDPYGSVRLVDAEGKDIQEGRMWWVTRIAVSGDTVVVVGEVEPSLRKYANVAFELDTRTGKMTMLPSVVAAEQRVEELKFGPAGGGWVDIEALPRAARPK